ncbi:transcriptional regulator, AraC family with amidase-like domain [Kushneria avicenniae]|uniref:Transcriptional regulator, AraC family with amidase-like domain n=1 Tax=Kushneria avicenniae TaxID=402385 RepID=A0A1I1MTB5_9GAMM|nr:GlxA family transcriptional regulator [Kushneria avicenniae]SFC85833.1 transcriptional regulator, AraC family with amidase-like domain [Kushneria avicenniae]
MSHTLDLFIYPGCQLLDASGPWQVFATANELTGKPLYQLRLLTEAAGLVTTNGGMALQATHALTTTPPGDTLLVAGGSGVHALEKDIIDVLAQRARRTPRVGSICTGAFALARAGLLDGRRATTHWRHAEALAHQFPKVQVDADALYLESDGVYTSAGITAGIDLALSLLAEDHGLALAAEVARELVMFLHRPGNQAQFSEGLKAQVSSTQRLRHLVDRVTAEPLDDWSSETMAEALAVTPRHLARLFRQELSMTPGDFLTRLRLETARRLLLESDTSPALIAEHCRLGGGEQLRRLFQRRFGLPPSLYRARFGSGSAS